MSYEKVAELYDLLMDDVDYQQWADYIHMLLQKHGCQGTRILDVGCGSGNITIPLAQMGYQLTAVDNSVDMLALARAKSQAAGVSISWLEQDITAEWPEAFFVEDGAFDAIIATFDVLNHLTEPEDLQMLLQVFGQLLTSGGILIFDVQTPYKLRQYLGDTVFTLHRPDVEYMWENHFDEEAQICQMDITMFKRCENGLYRRYEMQQEERLYDLDMLQMWLRFSDLEVLGLYGELSEQPLQPEDLRAVFVARAIPYGEDFWADTGIEETIEETAEAAEKEIYLVGE